MAQDTGTTSVFLRVICLNPPTCAEQPSTFGLQDKAGTLQPGEERPNGALSFTCTLQARRVEGSERPNWLGRYAHGTPDVRFLYLSLADSSSEAPRWIRRMKVPLGGITWAQIESAVATNGIMETKVDGRKSGTVALLGGWTLVDAS